MEGGEGKRAHEGNTGLTPGPKRTAAAPDSGPVARNLQSGTAQAGPSAASVTFFPPTRVKGGRNEESVEEEAAKRLVVGPLLLGKHQLQPLPVEAEADGGGGDEQDPAEGSVETELGAAGASVGSNAELAPVRNVAAPILLNQRALARTHPENLDPDAREVVWLLHGRDLSDPRSAADVVTQLKNAQAYGLALKFAAKAPQSSGLMESMARVAEKLWRQPSATIQEASAAVGSTLLHAAGRVGGAVTRFAFPEIAEMREHREQQLQEAIVQPEEETGREQDQPEDVRGDARHDLMEE
ncbi:hypothetical protein DFJ74DRAFT_708657 [Hyaloraphidium curvatum]|nr:hypothetical protein DFJ74DRAFT_708657 [Hyaloraphidium curvatum]